MYKSNDTKIFLLTLTVLVLSCIPLISAHVALTYPPARKYDLDFLDNSRTKGPCGMPKGSIRTSYLAGSATNVTWHLAYPHRGGFRLQLLDHLERPVLDLTPSVGGTDFVRSDVTAQSFEVRFPSDFTCKDCTLRLLRQADEWSNGYRFWSCADIDIMSRKDFRETCSGHGKYRANRCKCDKRYYGSRCQYSDECEKDEECGAQGKCINLHGTSLPKRQCYCNFGWFGPNCSKKSPIKSKDLDLSQYSTKQLSPDYRIHWRILKEKNEIEIIAIVNGTSWVGLGWRPRKLNATCRNFPLLQKATPSEQLVTASVSQNSKTPGHVAAEPNAEKSPNAEPEKEPGSSSEPEPETKSEPSSEPTSEPKSEPASEPGAEPGTAEPEKEPAAEVQSKSPSSKPTPKSEPASEPESEPEAESKSTEKEPAPEASNKHPSSEPEPTSAPESEPEATTEPATEPPSSTTSAPLRPQPFRPRLFNKTKRVVIPLRERPNIQGASNLSKRHIRAAPKAEPEPATPEPEQATSEPISKSEPSAEVEPEPESKSEPEPESKSEPEPESKSEPEPESKSEPEPESKSEPEPETKSEPEPASAEPSGEPSSYTPNVEYISHEYAPKHDFNPMDCTDIVIGTARNQTFRVLDYYTRDRSTPRPDSFWGGSNDLTATGGFEENGVTTIMFRRKLESKDVADHSIVNDLMHVIWARGQEPGRYVHSPPSGLEKESASMRNFYQPDELKYHGHKTQRGVAQINFFEDTKPKAASGSNGTDSTASSMNVLDNNCEGQWKYPRTCEPDKFNCEYYASWQTIGRGDEFRVRIQTTNTKTWTGIGFSDDERMSQTDAIIGWVDPNGRPFLMDTWITGYTAPKLDDNQNIYNISGRIQNGVTFLEFTRKRETNDQNDLSFTEDKCLYLMFPVLGGRFNAVNKKMSKHEQTPVITDSRICIKSCGRELIDNSIFPVEKVPSQLAYAVSVKLMNLAESFESPAKGTPEFDSLASQIANSMAGVLSHIPGYTETEVNSFEKDKNAVIAKMNVLFDKAAFEKSQAVKTSDNNELKDGKPAADDEEDGKVIKDTILNSIQSAKLGALTVDPGFLHFRTLDHNIQEDEARTSFFNLSEVRLYTVIGLIAALVFVALLQAACTIYKTSSSSRNQKDKLIPNSAWKDYSANTNYAFDTVDGSPSDEKQQQKRNGSRMNTSSSSQQTLPLSHAPMKSHYYNVDTSGRHHQMASPYENGNGYSSGQYSNRYGNDRTYSLPRSAAGASSHGQRYSHQPQPTEGYYTQDRRRNNSRSNHHSMEDSATTAMDKPDFYFMPSQRKYSGEVVRVYVDYNKDMKK